MNFQPPISHSTFHEVEYLAKIYTGTIPHERNDVIDIDGVSYQLLLSSDCWDNLSHKDAKMKVSQDGGSSLFRVSVLEKRESVSQGVQERTGISVSTLLGENGVQ